MSCRELFVLVLARLVSYAAAGLASGLAGSLAFAAAAGFNALAQIAGGNGFNSFHGNFSNLMVSLDVNRYLYSFIVKQGGLSCQEESCLDKR